MEAGTERNTTQERKENIRKSTLYVRVCVVICIKYISYFGFHVSSMKLLHGFKLNLLLAAPH
jgi:hypothetical protein